MAEPLLSLAPLENSESISGITLLLQTKRIILVQWPISRHYINEQHKHNINTVD